MTARRTGLLALANLMLFLTLGAADARAACPDYVPAECKPIPANGLPKRVEHCYRIDSAGDRPIVEKEIHVLDGGRIYFV